MNNGILRYAVALVAGIGCRSHDPTGRGGDTVVVPAPERGPAGTTVPNGNGGGPAAGDTPEREGAIDSLAHARCNAAARCGAIGSLREEPTYWECVEIARVDLRTSFGASTCTAYDGQKLAACVKRTADASCNSYSVLADECAEPRLCR